MHFAKIGRNWHSGSRKEIFKIIRQIECILTSDGRTDGQMDGRRTTGDQKSSLELSFQVS